MNDNSNVSAWEWEAYPITQLRQLLLLNGINLSLEENEKKIRKT